MLGTLSVGHPGLSDFWIAQWFSYLAAEPEVGNLIRHCASLRPAYISILLQYCATPQQVSSALKANRRSHGTHNSLLFAIEPSTLACLLVGMALFGMLENGDCFPPFGLVMFIFKI